MSLTPLRTLAVPIIRSATTHNVRSITPKSAVFGHDTIIHSFSPRQWRVGGAPTRAFALPVKLCTPKFSETLLQRSFHTTYTPWNATPKDPPPPSPEKPP